MGLKFSGGSVSTKISLLVLLSPGLMGPLKPPGVMPENEITPGLINPGFCTQKFITEPPSRISITVSLASGNSSCPSMAFSGSAELTITSTTNCSRKPTATLCASRRISDARPKTGSDQKIRQSRKVFKNSFIILVVSIVELLVVSIAELLVVSIAELPGPIKSQNAEIRQIELSVAV